MWVEYVIYWFIIAAVINFANIFYRIGSKNDVQRTWQSDARTSTIAVIIDILIVAMLYFKW